MDPPTPWKIQSCRSPKEYWYGPLENHKAVGLLGIVVWTPPPPWKNRYSGMDPPWKNTKLQVSLGILVWTPPPPWKNRYSGMDPPPWKNTML